MENFTNVLNIEGMGGGRTYNIYYIIHYMTLYNVYFKVKERGGDGNFIRDGRTHTHTDTQKYI